MWFKTTCIFIFFSLRLFAQLNGQDTFQILTHSTFQLYCNQTGGLGSYNNLGLQMQNKPLVKQLHFWLSGEINTQAFGAGKHQYSSATSLVPGPISQNLRNHYTASMWPGILSITQNQIEDFKLNYFKTGYTIPRQILNYPANGKTGFADLLLPYSNQSGLAKYNPNKGDYPYLPGFKNTITLFSDSANKSYFHSQNIPVDVVSIWFTDSTKDSVAMNSAFVRLIACNRGNSTINNFRIGAAVAFQIGNIADDFLGTHVSQNAIYAYNAVPNDSELGLSWPAVAFQWLNTKAGSSMYYVGGTNIFGQPEDSLDYYYYCNAKWKTGARLGYFGAGLDNSTRLANFVYSGATDPTQNNVWMDGSVAPGNRSGVLSTAGQILPAKECKIFDACLTVIQNAPDTSRITKLLKANQNYYNKSTYQLNFNKSKPNPGIEVFPNPIRRGQAIQLLHKGNLEAMENVKIFDFNGKCIANRENVYSTEAPQKSGFYWMSINEKYYFKLIVIE